MRERLISNLRRADERRRLPGYIAVIFAIIFLFSYFLPMLCTFVDGQKESILGYYSFAYMNDDFDIIRYSIALLAISIALSGAHLICGLITIFCDQKNLSKARISILGVLIVKTICDVIFLVLAGLTETNIEIDWGGYILPFLDVIFLIVTIYLQINHSDSDEPLFKRRKVEEETSESAIEGMVDDETEAEGQSEDGTIDDQDNS